MSMDFRGICIPVWGPDFSVAHDSIRRAARLNANWVQLVTHWAIDTATPITILGTDRGIYRGANTASDESVVTAIRLAHTLGLKVMLKPHVDWTRGGWRGYFFMDPEDGWTAHRWHLDYRSMFQPYTYMSIREGVEAICVGCEFSDLNKNPGAGIDWTSVVADIRVSGYKGLLTYAANWGYGGDAEYNRPGLQDLWPLLDYIGVDAYYPLSLFAEPRLTLPELRERWLGAPNPWAPEFSQNHLGELEALAHKWGTRVLFTEVGYPATMYAGANPGGDPPGEWRQNEAYQADLYRAVFDTFSGQEWFAGMFAWQGGPTMNSHQVLKRPSGEVLQKRYKTFREATT